MYRYWIAALLFGALVSAVCIIFSEHFGWGAFGRFISLLPFQLVVTVYYVSMLIVRECYQRSDEVRYRAHYIRGIFYLLFLISWLFPLTAFLIASV